MEQKICRACNKTKSMDQFYVHKAMKDGHLNICVECVKLRVRKHRETHDSTREYDRKRYRENPKRRINANERTKEYRLKFPEKYKARTAVNNAVRDKRLKKEPCVICGNIRSTAHHEDYSKPLNVIWLCHLHHNRMHYKL